MLRGTAQHAHALRLRACTYNILHGVYEYMGTGSSTNEKNVLKNVLENVCVD